MTFKILTVVFTAVALVAGHPGSAARAGGPGDPTPSCLVNNPGGATALRGTVAVGGQSAGPGTPHVDFTLRLERGGAFAFFRASVDTEIFATSNENILCSLLNDNQSQAAADLRAAILSTFGLTTRTQFVITDRSISKAEIQGQSPQWVCNNTYTTGSVAPPPSCADGSTPRAASMADVIIYAR